MGKTAAAAAAKTPADKAVADDKHTTDGAYGDYEIKRIRISPDNRKRFNQEALQELAASIKAIGLAQPILIRIVTPTDDAPEDFEIVAGERRFRASIIAGRTTIPAVCRNLSDLDAAKLRILENLQREDPHPMEEAEGYQQLMLQHGYTADQLAEEIKKSRAYVYGRLKLCALTLEVREQFLDNKIPASTALLIARIPVPALQARALDDVLNPNTWPSSEPLSYRRAAEHIQRTYTLDLTTAIFPVGDAKLLAAAGTCAKCPKRTGNQPEVFAGISADVCTDPDCFGEKCAAFHARAVVLANKQGIPVLEGDKALEALRDAWDHDSELVTDSIYLHRFDRNAPATASSGTPKTLIDADEMPAPSAYAKKADGALVALYDRATMQAALEQAGACETVEAHQARMHALGKKTDTARQERMDTEDAALKVKTEQENIFRLALYKQLRQRGAQGFSLASLREITKSLFADFSLPTKALADVYTFDTTSDAAVLAHIDQAPLAETQMILADLMLGSYLSVAEWEVRGGRLDEEGGFDTVLAMARHEGIDPDHVRESLFPTAVDPISMDDFVAAPVPGKAAKPKSGKAKPAAAPAAPVLNPAAAWPFPTANR